MSSFTPLILVGTVSGNSTDCAKKLSSLLAEASLTTRLQDMSDFPPENLAQERCVFIVTSTWGDGEPPDNAVALWDYLVGSHDKIDLSHLAYGVLALGSRDFEHFCKCGKDFDKALAQHGAMRICPLIECDNSWESEVEDFAEAVLPFLISPLFSSSNRP